MWQYALTGGTVVLVAGVKSDGSGVVRRPVLRPSSYALWGGGSNGLGCLVPCLRSGC